MGARAPGGAFMLGGPEPQAARARATRTTAKARKSLTGAPSGLAADAVVDAEEVVRVDLLLDREQPRVVDAPERALPVRLEVVGLVGVGARPRGRVADDLHRPGDHVCRSLAFGEVRLVTGDPRVRAALVGGNDDQTGGVEGDGVHARLALAGDRLGRRAGQALVEM